MGKKKKNDSGEEKKVRSKKRLMVLIILLAILVPAITTQLFWFFGPGCVTKKNAIVKYYQAVENEDVSQVKKVSYPRKWQRNYEPNGQKIDLDSVIKASFMYQSGASYSDVKIVSEQKLPSDSVNDFRRGIKDVYGVDLSISEVCKVTFRMTVTLSSGQSQDSGDIIRYLYRVGGKWFYLSDSLLQVHLDLD